jgi:hypothetical protein
MSTYHARAGEGVPAKADAISVLNLAPLVLQCLKIGHLVLCSSGCIWGRGIVVGPRAPTGRAGGAVYRSLHVLVLGNCGRNKRKYNEDVAAGWSRGCKQKAKSLRSQSSRDAAEWVTIEGQIGHSWSLLPIGSSTTEAPSSFKTLEFSLPPLLFFYHRQQPKHYLRQPRDHS